LGKLGKNQKWKVCQLPRLYPNDFFSSVFYDNLKVNQSFSRQPDTKQKITKMPSIPDASFTMKKASTSIQCIHNINQKWNELQ
jgi:hypothetical protein